MKRKLLPFNKSRLRGYIRREWMYSRLRRDALAQARVERGRYKCSSCGNIFGPKEIDINHKVVVTPENGLNSGKDWGILIDRMLYCGLEGLEAMCKECHKTRTKEENIIKTIKKRVDKSKKK